MADGFGKYDIYTVAGSIYCYPDSDVLRNRFNIRDKLQLRMVETDISAARQAEMINHPVKGRFTANHLCQIHRKLLGDVYSFAGHFRKEDIAKGDTRFVNHAAIPTKLHKLLSQLQAESYLTGLNTETLIDRSAYYMSELNYIHPFREGNGRTVREFMRLLFLRCGYLIYWDQVPAESLLQAMVDSIYDTESLKNVLCCCLVKE